MGEIRKTTTDEAASNEGPADLVDVQVSLRALMHELRSPLQSMLSSADVLDAVELPAGPRRAMDRLQRSALALEMHLGDLATLLLIHSGDLGVFGDPGEWTDFFEVSGLLREVEALAARMGLPLTVEGAAASVVAVADAHLLRSVLLRLVHTFAKLTDSGSLTISGLETPAGVSALRVQVRCIHAGAWPAGFEDRLLPARAMVSAVGGRLDLGHRAATLTMPARIDDGRGRMQTAG